MKITWNTRNINKINEQANKALIDTAETIRTDLFQSQTMPFDTGTLQNASTFVDDKKVIKGVVKIVSDTPYARKMYFHPEYNFNKKYNPNAGGRWLDTYIIGAKKKLPFIYYEKHLKRRLGQ